MFDTSRGHSALFANHVFPDGITLPDDKLPQMMREIIKSVSPDIVEQIKWNAPSFSYKGEYLATFNLWEKKRIHLVFHNPRIARVKSKLLEGDYHERRMAYFADQDDIRAKTPALQKALQDLIRLQKKPKEKA